MRAALTRVIWVEFHVYALILELHGAVAMTAPRECLSKRYAAWGVKRMLPWCLAIDQTESRWFVTLGFTTVVTLNRWPLFICIAVYTTCVQGNVWFVAVLVLWRTGRDLWIGESSFIFHGSAPESKI